MSAVVICHNDRQRVLWEALFLRSICPEGKGYENRLLFTAPPKRPLHASASTQTKRGPLLRRTAAPPHTANTKQPAKPQSNFSLCFGDLRTLKTMRASHRAILRAYFGQTSGQASVSHRAILRASHRAILRPAIGPYSGHGAKTLSMPARNGNMRYGKLTAPV